MGPICSDKSYNMIGNKQNDTLSAISTLSNKFNSFYEYCKEQPVHTWDEVLYRDNEYVFPIYKHLEDWYYGSTYANNRTPIYNAITQLKDLEFIDSIHYGENDNYPQSNSRDRMITFLLNVTEGIELWKWQALVLDMEKNRK